jgi:hypothetical protein
MHTTLQSCNPWGGTYRRHIKRIKSWRSGLLIRDSGPRSAKGFCDRRNERSGSRAGGEYTGQITDHYLLTIMWANIQGFQMDDQ